jgi:hypothetical protein
MSVVPYEVTINEIHGAVIDLTVCLIHPDFLTFPVSKTFAFQLLGEPMLDARGNRALGRGMPLSQVMEWEDLLDEAYLIEYAEGFIASVELKTTQNYPTTEDDLLKALESREPGQQVTGTYQIVATHPGWTLHLKPAMTFQTTAIDLGDGTLWHGPSRVPGDTSWLRAGNQTAGFKSGTQDDFSGVGQEYFVPAHGASYYEPDPVLIGADITSDALHRLLHQPVVLRVEDDFDETHTGFLLDIAETSLTLYKESGRFRRGKTRVFIQDLIYIGVARYRIPLIHG